MLIFVVVQEKKNYSVFKQFRLRKSLQSQFAVVTSSVQGSFCFGASAKCEEKQAIKRWPSLGRGQ